jgi:lipoprotein-releasing system ATP-binding protein
MNKSVLSLHNIVHIYKQGGRALTVLNHLDLDIRQGEITALVGPSGSGKTTLLQIAGLLDTPTSGNVIISGESMNGAGDARRTAARRDHIGFIYQFHNLLPEFSALENVMLPQMITGTDKKTASKKATELLGSLGLSDRLHHGPAALSGGEQ